MTLGKRISEERKRLSLSQEYIAEKLGVSRQAVSKWETDQSSPDTNNLIALAELFGVSVEYLATGKVPEAPMAEGTKAEKSTAKICGFILLGAGLLSLVLGVLLSALLVLIGLYLVLVAILCITVKKCLGLVIASVSVLPALLYFTVFRARISVAELVISKTSPGTAVGIGPSLLFYVIIPSLVALAAIIIIPKIRKKK